MSDRVIEINGEKYTKQGADFQAQTDKVISILGGEMLDAIAQGHGIIAGGAVLSAFTNAEVADVDVYFRSKEDLTKAFLAITKNWEGVYLGHTDKSITMHDKEGDVIVQFIYFDYFTNAEAVFEAFDFTVCMAAVEIEEQGEQLILDPRFLSDMASRTLKFNNGTRFPYISLIRTRKYQEKGYKIGKGNLLAIAVACANAPITSWEEASYQLGGVYGNEIKLAVDKEEEFSTEKLHILMTKLKDSQVIMHNDYPEIYRELTGIDYK